MLFLQVESLITTPETVQRGLAYVWELGIAGVLFLLLMIVFYKVWKDIKEQREKLELLLSSEKEANVSLTKQIVEGSNNYAQNLLINERENTQSINDVTNSLSQLVILIKELRDDLNSRSKDQP